jgi:hypothetical protein
MILIRSVTFFGGRLSAATLLTGFMVLRVLMIKVALFEPITHDIAGKFGLSP